MKFWTCGPFKEFQDRVDKTNFRIEQQAMLQSILDELQTAEELYKNGSAEEILIATIMKTDLEMKLNAILGIQNDDGQTEDNEVFGEAIFKSISRFTKN